MFGGRELFLKASGSCLEGVRKVPKRSKEGMWKVSGSCPESVLLLKEKCLGSIDLPGYEGDFGIFYIQISQLP